MNRVARITIDLTNSPHVVLDVNEALGVLKCIEKECGETSDLKESIRIVNNFDEFYKYSRRKYRDYLTPIKNHSESLLGKTIVHKIRLFIENNNKYVEIVFDRRFAVDYLKKCLLEIGYSEVIVEKQFI